MITGMDDPTGSLRVPPHSVEAEQALLGAVLLQNSALTRVGDIITSADFYRQDHRKIFDAVVSLSNIGKTADVVSVFEILRSGEGPDLPYLADLVTSTPSAINAAHYARIVRERSIQRQLIAICAETIEHSWRPGSEGEVAEALEEHERRIFELRKIRSSGGSDFRALIGKVLDSVDRKYHAESFEISGLSTGFLDVDEMTDGLEPADLVLVAGRPSMGKTALAMNIAENFALRGDAVAVFSLEMSDEALAGRMMASCARIDHQKMRRGRLTDDDWHRLTTAVGKLHAAPIYIEETSGLSIADLRLRGRRLAREHGIKLIIVDYLQLMDVRGETKASGLGDVTRGMKALAKELGIPVIALSQLNRKLEERTNKRPIMADLRESGSLEQDADKILFIYRDEVYNPETPEPAKAEIIIGKNRNGPIGVVNLCWMKEFTRFENYASDGAPKYQAPAKQKRGFAAASDGSGRLPLAEG